MAEDYSVCVTARRYRLPAFPLNSAFSLVIGPTSDSQVFTGLTLDLSLTNTTTLTRVALTEADATLSGGDTVITFSKTKSWVASNLEAGDYDVLLFVSDAFYLHLIVEAFTPTGGEIDP